MRKKQPEQMQGAPPYQVILRIGLAVQIIIFGIIPGLAPGWEGPVLKTVTAIVSLIVLACAALAIYERVRDYRAGRLFFIRDLSFYVAVLSVPLIAIFAIIPMVGEVRSGAADWTQLLLAVSFVIGYGSQMMATVYLDSVRLELRRLSGSITVPLFNIEKITPSPNDLLVEGERPDEKILLQKGQFGASAWSELSTRLSAAAGG